MIKKERLQYALVTGATSGIGKQIAVELTKKGYKVIACGRDLNALLQLNAAYGMQLYPCDLSNKESVYALCKDVSDKNVTVVVNSAGVGFLEHFDKISDECDDMTVKLNITACQIITKFFARNMKKGVILNVCSSAAFSPEPLMASYASSKAYIYSYSRAIDHVN
ncbi:MAG: SDR family NAD(P)-dependent oxidoreductase [Clostridia bacterium]|nr:SDR family NAD(P)-dependent oxidoreductase [Clostridia bacterium]